MGQGEWERGMEEWGGGKIVLMTQRGGWGSGGQISTHELIIL